MVTLVSLKYLCQRRIKKRPLLLALSVLLAAQNNYVFDAPLGDIPIAGVDADVMNVWLAQYDDYLIV